MTKRNWTPLLALALLAACSDEPTAVTQPPEVQINSPAADMIYSPSEQIKFAGGGKDGEDRSLSGDALVWTSSIDGKIGTGSFFARADLSGGMHTLTLTGTDSKGASTTTTTTFRINQPPIAAITSPAAGTVYEVGDDVVFTGTGTDPEDGTLSTDALVWTSNLDGRLGTGATITRADLSRGRHHVILAVNDRDGGSAADTIEVVINRLPEVSITSPANGSVFSDAADLTLTGTATDPEDGTLTGGSLVWTSSVDGRIGTGESVSGAGLTDGTHTITLTAADGTGAADSASVSILVGPIVIEAGTQVTALTGETGSKQLFVVSLPEQAAHEVLRIRIMGGTGDADMYVRHGERPTTTVFDCAPRRPVPDELCEFTAPASGDWFILIHGSLAYSGMRLLVEAGADGQCFLTGPDTDGDRLPDCAETGTGVFNHMFDAGTDPNNPDTDGDGINDGDEVIGTTAGLDLPAMGTNPLRRDILLEYDWFDDAVTCGPHSHRPSVAQMERTAAAMAGAPTPNPDGSTGINFIQDYGQGGVFTGGNRVADADGVIAGGVNNPEYLAYKRDNFAANRHGYFHYVLMPHRYNTDSNSSGQAEVNGDDMIVSLQCGVGNVSGVSNTILHELGHNLGLLHGGGDGLNWKPNYNSLMNYKYQFPGVDDNCTPPGDGVPDFSHGTRPDLNENSLVEAEGICGAEFGGWDWNGDGDIADVGLVLDINTNGAGEGDGLMSVLRDYNDWARISLAGIGDFDGAPFLVASHVVSCRDTPLAIQVRH